MRGRIVTPAVESDAGDAQWARAQAGAILPKGRVIVGYAEHPAAPQWQLFISLYGSDVTFLAAYAGEGPVLHAQTLLGLAINERRIYTTAGVARLLADLGQAGSLPMVEMPDETVLEILAMIAERPEGHHG